MYSDQLVYKVVIWAFVWISLSTEKVALSIYIQIKQNRIDKNKKWNNIFETEAWHMNV